jgi:hypothetical protein
MNDNELSTPQLVDALELIANSPNTTGDDRDTILEAAGRLSVEIDAVQDLAQLRKDYAGLLMELELERGRVKSLKATVVNQAEHITHLTALNISAEHDRAIHAARDNEYNNEGDDFYHF